MEPEDDDGESERRRLPSYPILKDHVRNKKRLVPPILSIGNTQSVSTLDSIFPEIFWVGILLDWHGTRDGIEVVSLALKSLWETDEKINWYRISQICANPDKLARSLNADQRHNVEIAFSTLRAVYGCNGLDWAEPCEDYSESVRRVIRTVEKYSDRFEQPYLIIVSTIIYSMAISGKMKFAPGTVPNIEAIVEEWGSEDAEMAASSVRACSMAFFPHDQSSQSEDWCQSFWRTNYKLSGCQF